MNKSIERRRLKEGMNQVRNPGFIIVGGRNTIAL
jgi:hypothetical protein